MPLSPWKHFGFYVTAGLSVGLILGLWFNNSLSSISNAWGGTFGISGVVGILFLVFAFLDRKKTGTEYIHYFSQTCVRLFLASIFFVYGYAKAILQQFRGPLFYGDVSVSELSGFETAWYFFGYSETYQMVMGWAEIIPACLLCFRRTQLAGAIILLPVIGNIVLANFFYDIPVKLQSTVYLILTLYLILSQTPRLWQFFFTDKSTPPVSIPKGLNDKSYIWVTRITEACMVIGALGIILFAVWNKFKERPGRDAQIEGYWESPTVDTQFGDYEIKGISIGPDNMGQFKNTDGSRTYFKYKIIEDGTAISIEPFRDSITFEYQFKRIPSGLEIYNDPENPAYFRLDVSEKKR